MNKQDLERRLEAAEKQMIGLQDEIQNLKAKLNKVQDDEIPDFPFFANGEGYWFVNTEFEDIGNNNFGRSTGIEYEDFNMFHTKEMAQEFAEKCKFIAMMLHCKWYLCCDCQLDFNNGLSQKWTVVFNYNEGKFTVEFSRMREWSTIYFDTEENAKKCADWLNKHWKENADE